MYRMENAYRFMVRGDLTTYEALKPLRDANYVIVGFELPDGRKARPIMAFEVESADENSYAFTSSSEELNELGIAIMDYDACQFQTKLSIGDSVIVPDPQADDCYSHSFEGTVIGFRSNFVQVEDQESQVFDIEPERLILAE